MYLAGLIMTLILVIGGFVIAELTFYKLNGRFFWRAFVPVAVRLTIFPKDKVEMDVFEVIAEYTALILYGSFMIMPLMAMNHIGFTHFF